MAGWIWHHLQLKDKLESHRNCRLCKKPVLGSRGYKCGKCGDFFLHESCPVPTDKIEIEARHDLGSTHHLISMKEVDNNGENKVVCSLCEEPVSGLLGNNGPTIYKCSIPNCSFLLLHEPCAQLPITITTHPLHLLPNHGLVLIPLDETNNREFCCRACGKVFTRGFCYYCGECSDYRLDFKCASRCLNISTADNCNRHAFFPTRNPIQFTCEVCGGESSDVAYLCSNCRLLIHFNCIKFLGSIKVRGHGHSLTCTFSLSKGKKHKCQVCYEEVDTKYAAYCCDDHKCGYIAHLRCAYWLRRDVSETSTVSVEYTTHLVEDSDLKEDEKTGPQEIQHPSHPQHKLIIKK
ncbi:uncharacterized protein LOC133882503 [Alnus glutinosa]|uniref:uncharacterized protein LOC133882503 n=1 Tax=Alnus glutinosa TaxID=3517 RepID=UPI002D777461|nr:uncharacterized protein LOC133882503 [Alnus glutinosa]